jgi:hypothetical protein
MKKVVIESPLAGDFARNQQYARLCALDCRNRGEAAYASHLFYTQFLDDRSPDDRAFGITAGYEWAQYADLVAIYIDLDVSAGMHRAYEHWKSQSKEIESRRLPLELLALLDADHPKTEGSCK